MLRNRLLVPLLVFASVAFAEARFSGENGARRRLTRLAAGVSHTCAIGDDGSVQCWGLNRNGQLGDGTTTNRSAPVPVRNLASVISVAAGEVHSCALLSNGFVNCWGDNSQGQLGNGTTSPSATPVTVSGLVNATALSSGFDHNCAVRADGTVWCWGRNDFGQLGSMAGSVSLAAVQVPSVGGAVSVAAGFLHTCALLASGTVECWGLGSVGQLGNGVSNNSAHPPAATSSLSATAGVGAVELAAGQLANCALLSDHSVSCWGAGELGQLGNGTGPNGGPVRSAVT